MARYLCWFFEGLSALAGLAAFVTLAVAFVHDEVPWSSFAFLGVAIVSAVLACSLKFRKTSKLVVRRLPNVHALPSMLQR